MIITSSAAALKNVPGPADHVAAKNAVIALAAAVANEVAAERIRVNVIAPSIVNTPMVTENPGRLRLFRPDLESPNVEDCMDVFRAVSPMGAPWIEPADVAEAVVHLAGDASRWITGAVLPVDHGSAVRRTWTENCRAAPPPRPHSDHASGPRAVVPAVERGDHDPDRASRARGATHPLGRP